MRLLGVPNDTQLMAPVTVRIHGVGTGEVRMDDVATIVQDQVGRDVAIAVKRPQSHTANRPPVPVATGRGERFL